MSIASDAASEEGRGEPRTERAGIPIPCPQCRYDLRGLIELRCPECGTSLEILAAAEESVAESSYRWGIGGLIGTAGIGFLFLLSALGVYPDVLFFGTWLGLSIFLIRWWIGNGRSMLARQYPDVRRAIVFVCWFGWVVVLALGVMIIFLR
jgi:hypothetical protein